MKKRKLPFWILIYAAGILILAAVINYMMGLSIQSSNASLDATAWLGFWGSYLGGAIGCLPALAALLHSKAQAEEQRQDVEKDRHLANLPVLDNNIIHIQNLINFPKGSLSSTQILLESCHDPKGFSINNVTLERISDILDADHSDVILLQMKNIGHGPALSVSLHFEATSQFPLGALAEGETFNLILSLARSPDSTYPLKFSFSDMLDWKYSQRHQVYVGTNLALVSPISAPVLES